MNRSGQKPIQKKAPEKKNKFIILFNKYPSLIIFLFAFFLYTNTLVNGYALDDGLMIENNNFTKKGFSGITDILTHDQLGGQGSDASAIYQGGRYRPLSQVLFAIEVQLFGMKAFPMHLVHIFMYSLLCFLLFITLKKIFSEFKADKWYTSIPFVAALLFAAHPIHTEVAANIKSADEVMCMIGAIMSLYFSLKYIDEEKRIYLFYSFLFMVFGVFSKENAVTFIAVIPLTIYFFRKAELKKYIYTILPLVAGTIVYFIIRFLVIGFSTKEVVITELFHNPFLYATTSERYATVMFTWLKYLILLVFPHPLTHDYYPKQIPIINWADVRAIVPLIIYVAMGVYALLKIKSRNIISFGILFYLITFSVTSNLLFNLGLFMNERFMFIPSLGFIIVLTYLFITLFKIVKERNLKNYVPLILSCVLLLYSVKTISRNTAWKDNYTLYTTDAKTSVNSSRCNVIAGSMYLAKGRDEKNEEKKNTYYQEAYELFKKGVGIYERNIEGWNCLGEVSIYLEKYDEAEVALKKVLKLDTLNESALHNYSYIAFHYQELKQDDKALTVYNYLNSQKPEVNYYSNIADIYNRKGNTDTAITIINYALKMKPDYIDAYNQLAKYYALDKKDFKKSLECLEKAYSINPKFQPTLENLGIIYGMKSDYKNSLLYLEKALQLDSTNASVCRNIGKTYDALGNAEKANYYFVKAMYLSKQK